MASWIDPVYDRTQADVDFALLKISEWIAGDVSGDSCAVYDLKGCLNVFDINRIEENIKYLADRLTEYYYKPDTTSKSWTKADLPNASDIARILYNVTALRNAFVVPTDAPAVPEHMLGYEEVNAVEKNLDLIRKMLDVLTASFKKSGTFYSGSTLVLPARG